MMMLMLRRTISYCLLCFLSDTPRCCCGRWKEQASAAEALTLAAALALAVATAAMAMATVNFVLPATPRLCPR